MKRITLNFLLYLLIMSGLIFLTGVFEVSRNEYMFEIVENNVLIQNSTPTEIYNTYLNIKSDNLFNNTYFVYVLNFFGFLGVFYLIYDAFKSGWESKPLSFSEIFFNYGLLLILLFYLLLILFNYFKDVFVNQILIILFNDLLNEIFIFNFFTTYFIGLFLIAILLKFFANQIRHFKTIDI